MTTIEYFKSQLGFPVSDPTVEAKLFDRGFVKEDSYQSMSLQSRELIYADLLVYGAYMMNKTIRRGGFSEAISNNVSTELLKKANDIYKKYNDDRYDSDIEGQLLNWIEYE